MPILAQTVRLTLRTWHPDDIEPYARMAADPEVMRFIGDGQPRPPHYAEDYVSRMIEQQNGRGWMRFAVEHTESGEFMGFCGFDLQAGRIDFGWRYARAFWGAGYGWEAAEAAMQLGTDRFGLQKITAQSVPDNVGSVRIIQKLGMHPIGEYLAWGKRTIVYGAPGEWPDGIELEDIPG